MTLPVHPRGKRLGAQVGSLVIGCVLLAWLAAAPVAAAATTAHEIVAPKVLPASAWDHVKGTPGIVFGRTTPGIPDVQMICDVHCPYCARVYTQLVERRPALRVRWVPIAYFKPDSDRVAAAILAAPDPRAALDRNYRAYDHAARRGGYGDASADVLKLDASHAALKERWRGWGRFTPMVLVRAGDGTVLQAAGTSPAFLDPVLDRAGRSKQAYDAW